MSLKVDDGRSGRRSRSKSPGRRDDRSRSRSRLEILQPESIGTRERSRTRGDDDLAYERVKRERVDPDLAYGDNESVKYAREEGSRKYDRPTSPLRKSGKYDKYSRRESTSESSESESDRSRDRSSRRDRERDRDPRRYEEDKYSRGRYEDPPPRGIAYVEPKQYEYARPHEQLLQYPRAEEAPFYNRESPRSSQYVSPNSSSANIVTAEPGGLSSRMHSLSVSTSGGHGLSMTAGSSRGRSNSASLVNAPGSPLLEAYHGTYQSISPMPSPLLLAQNPYGTSSIPDLEVIEPLSPSTTRRKHARFHDPADDAAILAKALRGEKYGPDTAPLIDILPGLSHEQIMELRAEYKRIVKTGSEKKGVNIAKHIKLCLKEEDPSLMKACYATALGQWESEAYWANFWYQNSKSRRELLIESLMGRTNAEIRLIKEGFRDKKYSDSLSKCMAKELKEDKFKKAVMLVLEERRMEEPRGWEGVDGRLVGEDVRELHRCVRSERGGETAMIGIVVLRSEAHLREILRVYEQLYRANFAREMLKKSGNLVGEVLAHILNGVINRPVRDAMLLHHALSSSSSKRHGDSLRTELLISRLVRYHWERHHMEAVKREYRQRYGVELIEAVREGTKGEWGEFCAELCVYRQPTEVKRIGEGSIGGVVAGFLGR